MLQFLNLSATLAAVFMTQVTGAIASLPSKDTAARPVQASTHDLVVSHEKYHVIPAILTADSDNNTLEETERVNPALVLGLTALGIAAVGAAMNAKGSDSSKLSSIPSHFHSKSTASPGNIRIEQASRRLQKKLLRLLHDDRDTANRLLSQAQRKNPNKSVDWYAEKAIYDLERDRGGY
jgi:hypothetical protein